MILSACQDKPLWTTRFCLYCSNQETVTTKSNACPPISHTACNHSQPSRTVHTRSLVNKPEMNHIFFTLE
ncbi:hypothetical protein LguiA_000276 [Lonicera macranthoides]